MFRPACELRATTVAENRDIDHMLAWCEQEVVLIGKQIERLQAGTMTVRQSNDAGEMVDTTSQTIAQCEAKLAVLKELVENRKKAPASEPEI
jgi:hypothetical protein